MQHARYQLVSFEAATGHKSPGLSSHIDSSWPSEAVLNSAIVMQGKGAQNLAAWSIEAPEGLLSTTDSCQGNWQLP